MFKNKYLKQLRKVQFLIKHYKTSIEKLKCAVCPECGYTETYVENIEKIKKLVKKTGKSK